jgi:membrane protein
VIPLNALVQRIAGYAERPRIATARAVLDLYGSAGGGLLAGGLAFSALFALLPGVLLMTAILGMIVADPARREQIVDAMAGSVPPLADLIRTGVTGVSQGAIEFSIVGIVGLAWAASRFYSALDGALARIFVGTPRRSVVSQTIRGLVALGGLVGAVVLVIALGSVAQQAADSGRLPSGLPVAGFVPIALDLVAFGVVVGALWVVFTLVPTVRPRWGDVRRPLLFAGLALAGFTRIFVLVGPRILGAAAVYAAFFAVFAAMFWLSTTFQIVLIGAAWVRVRELARRARIDSSD